MRLWLPASSGTPKTSRRSDDGADSARAVNTLSGSGRQILKAGTGVFARQMNGTGGARMEGHHGRAVLFGLAMGLCVMTACTGFNTPGRQAEAEEAQSVKTEVAHRILESQPTAPMESDDFVTIRLAENEQDLKGTWSFFRMKGSPPTVDWERELVILFGIGESAGCPVTALSTTLNREAGLFTVTFPLADGVCTSEYSGRTMVVAFHRDDLPVGVFRIETNMDLRNPFHTVRVGQER